MKPAVFLDRDDTLIEDMAYTADPDRVRLLPGAAAAIRRLREAGYLVVVATNQSGVARGLFGEEQLAETHQRMRELLRDHGAGLDAIYFCPFLPGPDAVVPAFRKDSDLRKPKPGMLLQAAADMDIDLAASWMIGDAPRDAEAGRAAGCRTIMLTRSNALPPRSADFTAPDLAVAADVVLANSVSDHANDADRRAAGAPQASQGDGAARRDGGAGIASQRVSGARATAAIVETAHDRFSAPGSQPRLARAATPAARGGLRVSDADDPTVIEDDGTDAIDELERIATRGDARRVREARKAQDAPDAPDALPAGTGETSVDLLFREVRQWHRESRGSDYSAGHLIGAVAQTFAATALLWGIYGLLDDTQAARPVELRFLAAIALQLVALTYFRRT
jgi:D-glycero-D-manno-heptose 1,7-bisphosphate phosphatase